MKVMYQSFDGKFFDTEEECVEYENTFASLEMYGPNGKTYNVEEAIVIYLHDEKESELFIDKCYVSDSISHGIQEGDKGMFIWDYSNDEYVYVNPLVVEALKEYFRDKINLEASSS